MPGIIKKTGMVKIGFNKYLIEGFKRGIPPTEATLIKKNTILTNIRQNPIEYMSFLLNCKIFSVFPFRKYLGSMAHPIKKPAKASINVMAKLPETEFSASNRNTEKTKSTISGLKM